MSQRELYFSRVAPLLGEGLRAKTVRFANVSLTGRVVELLASCMLQRVILEGAGRPPAWPLPSTCRGPARRGPEPATAGALLARYLRFKNRFAPIEWLRGGPAELHIGGRLIPAGKHPHLVWERRRRRVSLRVAAGDLFGYQNLTYSLARQVRELLLGRAGWPEGTVYYGSAAWPFSESRRPLGAPPAVAPISATLAGRHVMVIGCGSVGSELVRLLASTEARWTLVDAGEVSLFNPVRQWFGSNNVGRRKVDVLRRRLGAANARAVPWNVSADAAQQLEHLLDEDPPDAVLLTTGTREQGFAAGLLQKRAIPHVVAHAYPQARFFEVTTVVPAEATPCLSCFRGHLYRGREASPPLSDELASFLYREVSDEERATAYQDLVAEPASLIETSRVADLAARCLVEALRPASQRALWMQRMIRSGTTCLIGGNTVDEADGSPAYGITYPGQIVRLGVGDIVGTEAVRRCPACERRLDVSHRLELPTADGGEIDRALAGS